MDGSTEFRTLASSKPAERVAKNAEFGVNIHGLATGILSSIFLMLLVDSVPVVLADCSSMGRLVGSGNAIAAKSGLAASRYKLIANLCLRGLAKCLWNTESCWKDKCIHRENTQQCVGHYHMLCLSFSSHVYMWTGNDVVRLSQDFRGPLSIGRL